MIIKIFSASSSLKRFAALLTVFAVVMLASACRFSAENPPKPPRAAKPAHSDKESGLMLDTARRFYTAEEIKQFIDAVAASGGTFLHLHFSDHENYALESPLLGQNAADARVGADGVHTNPRTGKPFLSYAQLNGIVRHARAKNIELVPEVGSPNHMTGIFTLLEQKHGAAYVRALKSKTADDEIDITKPASIAFMKSLLAETAQAFGSGSRHFHIGGDEFGYSIESNHEFIGYANTLASFLAAKGLKTRMWNDGLIKPTFERLHRNIEITYWSYDGDPADRRTAAARRRIRASLPDLLDKGFDVLNYNSYFLYIVPSEKRSLAHDAGFAERDVRQRWHLGVWDGENQENAVQNTDKIRGAALAVWGEHAGSLGGGDIRRHTEGLLEAVIRKTHAAQTENTQR